MIVYMLRSLDSCRYYQEITDCWVEQSEASVWTYRLGPASCKLKSKVPSKIVSFTIEEIK